MITTVQKIEDHCLLDEGPAKKIFKYADSAENMLRYLITSDSYDEIASNSGSDNYKRLQRAESYLSLWSAMPFLNLRPTELGGLSKIIGYGDEATEQLMSQRELEGYRGRFYGLAVEVIEEFRQDVDDDTLSYNAGPISMA